jgi:hypothetical protein
MSKMLGALQNLKSRINSRSSFRARKAWRVGTAPLEGAVSSQPGESDLATPRAPNSSVAACDGKSEPEPPKSRAQINLKTRGSYSA